VVFVLVLVHIDITSISTTTTQMKKILRKRILLFKLRHCCISAALAAIDYSQTYYDKMPYHNSALSGAAWACELLTGHPKCICKELGVHKHVFRALIVALQDAGHTRSKFVTLEEQLAIFLYTRVTGLSLIHVCERFQ